MLNFCFRILTVVCLLAGFARPVYALTEAQVVERLANIPIFVITDREGIPLVGSNSNNETQDRVLPFFLSPQEAEATLKTIEEGDKEELNARVIVRSMQDMYNFVQANQDKKLTYQIVPSQSSLKSASELMPEKGDQLPNVPVFFAIDQREQGNNGLFTVFQGERVFIPFFFEKQELDRFIEQVAMNDQTETKVEVKVISFFQVLNSMIDTEENKTNPDVERFTFFPGQKSFQWISANVKTDATPQTLDPSANS